eukprot:1157324-Rhodomonas_salina.1
MGALLTGVRVKFPTADITFAAWFSSAGNSGLQFGIDLMQFQGKYEFISDIDTEWLKSYGFQKNILS